MLTSKWKYSLIYWYIWDLDWFGATVEPIALLIHPKVDHAEYNYTVHISHRTGISFFQLYAQLDTLLKKYITTVTRVSKDMIEAAAY